MNIVLIPSIEAVVTASSATEPAKLYRTASGSTSKQTAAAENSAPTVRSSL